ncbi:MAG: 3-carboxyethylcatechol 2,3-dioxygenase [bacterium]|nr:3-carboxyethylcatechol 2,3-dioxygenase [bacterium]MCP5065552.1 3-carboxyethylcatechol 2,3-dioxygenase [bacterium]
MSSMLICASHSPLLTTERPTEHDDVMGAFGRLRDELERFDPELIVMFAPDHYTGVHMRMMPLFCLGTAARAVPGDFGGFPGAFDVPAEIALELADSLRQDRFDVAVSHDLEVDHGFSQPIHFLTGALDRYPLIPIFTSIIAGPRPSLARSRELGESVGRILASSKRRVAVIGSGGLSHDPSPLFPDFAGTQEGVHRYQLLGPDSPDLSREDWLERIKNLTLIGAKLFRSGEAASPCRPDFDRQFLDTITSGSLEEFDSWENGWIVEQGGLGAAEIHFWVAAAAASQALGCDPPTVDYYAPVPAYGISVGILHAGPTQGS